MKPEYEEILSRHRNVPESDLVTVTISIDTKLLEEVKLVLEPEGLTPEDAIIIFFDYCVNPATKEAAISMIKSWQHIDYIHSKIQELLQTKNDEELNEKIDTLAPSEKDDVIMELFKLIKRQKRPYQ